MQTTVSKTYTTTDEVIEKTICDLCGAETPGADWPQGGGVTKTIEISQDETWDSGYMETGGSKEKVIFDVCPACWQTKVVPWFASQGAQPRTEKSDS